MVRGQSAGILGLGHSGGSSGSGHAGDLAPVGEGLVTLLAIVVGGKAVAARAEVAGDGTVGGAEALRVAGCRLSLSRGSSVLLVKPVGE